MTTEIAVVLGSMLGAVATAIAGFLRYRLAQRKISIGHEDSVLKRLERENQRLEQRLLTVEAERDLEERRAVMYRRALYASGIEVPDVT